MSGYGAGGRGDGRSSDDAQDAGNEASPHDAGADALLGATPGALLPWRPGGAKGVAMLPRQQNSLGLPQHAGGPQGDMAHHAHPGQGGGRLHMGGPSYDMPYQGQQQQPYQYQRPPAAMQHQQYHQQMPFAPQQPAGYYAQRGGGGDLALAPRLPPSEEAFLAFAGAQRNYPGGPSAHASMQQAQHQPRYQQHHLQQQQQQHMQQHPQNPQHVGYSPMAPHAQQHQQRFSQQPFAPGGQLQQGQIGSEDAGPPAWPNGVPPAPWSNLDAFPGPDVNQ